MIDKRVQGTNKDPITGMDRTTSVMLITATKIPLRKGTIRNNLTAAIAAVLVAAEGGAIPPAARTGLPVLV